MIVHFIDRSGSTHDLECTSVQEAENGIFLMSSPNHRTKHQIGYIPFERLDFVEPEGD